MRTWLERLARFVYSLGMWLAQPLLQRKLRRRGSQEPGYLQFIDERFGHYAQRTGDSVGELWVHAVSLGETRAAALLLERLRAARPGLRVLLTHSTATGREEGKRLLQAGDMQAWLPWDTPGAVQRFLRHFQPSAGVLMETEVWPNLVHACQQQSVPLLLVNARFNERSWQKAQRLAWLARPSFANLTAVYAQTEADALRLRQLDAKVARVCGNLKFDVPWHPGAWAQGQACRAGVDGRPVIMWASSREGEEALWLDSLLTRFTALREGVSGVQPLWLVVPRHPQRFDAVAQLLQCRGLQVFRRSQWRGRVPPVAEWPAEAQQADVWLGDSLGEMPLYYGMAHMALLGGSFLPLGGQNLIEAAACECPVVMGPHTFNFAEAAAWAQQTGAAVEVPDLDAAMEQVTRWVQHPAQLDQAKLGCQTLIQQGAGAADRYAQAVLSYLTAPAGR